MHCKHQWYGCNMNESYGNFTHLQQVQTSHPSKSSTYRDPDRHGGLGQWVAFVKSSNANSSRHKINNLMFFISLRLLWFGWNRLPTGFRLKFPEFFFQLLRFFQRLYFVFARLIVSVFQSEVIPRSNTFIDPLDLSRVCCFKFVRPLYCIDSVSKRH